MMAGLLVSLVVRRRRVWIRIVWAESQTGAVPAPGTVNVELGGLARTDNSGWGDEFERVTRRLLDGFDAPATMQSAAMRRSGALNQPAGAPVELVAAAARTGIEERRR
jgi:cytochrome c biogenesis protein